MCEIETRHPHHDRHLGEFLDQKKYCCGVRLYLEHEQRERVGERAAAAEEVAVVDLGLVVARAEELGEQSRT